MPSPSRSTTLVAALAAALAAHTVWIAWVCDDAYITLRTVDHIARGFGPCWNTTERVQAYTHPLWMFLLAAVTTVTRERYVTTMVLGLAVSVLAVLVVARRVARGRRGAALWLALLLPSAAFGDYATSGLENPLAHLLLGLYLASLCGQGDRAVRGTFVFAALAVVNRLDAAVLVAPGVVLVALSPAGRANARWLAVATLPVLAWEVFSLVYYGALVPNPALAKLATGIPATALLDQGVHYLLNAWRHDPATLLATGLGIAVPLVQRDRRAAIVAVGIALHLLYVVSVGGDFMSGRFLTPSFFAAAAIVSRASWSAPTATGIAALGAAATLVAHTVPAGPAAGTKGALAAIDRHGIADERRFYARLTGWRFARRDVVWPDPATARAALAARIGWQHDPFLDRLRQLGLAAPLDSLAARRLATAGPGTLQPVVVRAAIGTFGYDSGPGMHVLDLYALADPLRARLPAEPRDPLLPLFLGDSTAVGWRPGHFVRRIPPGYFMTLATGDNHLQDPSMQRLWNDVVLATRGGLWRPGRGHAIGRLLQRAVRAPGEAPP